MWLEKQGRWQVKVQKDNERRTFTSSVQGRTGQREANAKADAWLDDGIVSSQRVAKLWNIYIEHEKASISPAALRRIESIGTCYIIPTIGNLKIDKLTESHLQKILDDAYRHGAVVSRSLKKSKSAEPLSRKSLSNILSAITGFIRYCRTTMHVTPLYPENVKIPSGARLKGKHILQPDNLTTLFTIDTTLTRGKVEFDKYIYAYRFAVATGLRPGELIGLQIGDFGENDIVNIKRSINTDNVETKGKNENAIRSFVMSTQAKKAYRGQLELLKADNIKLDYNAPFFQISTASGYYKRWLRYQKANNIEHISLYEMRHTFVSVVKYLPEGQVKALVGHSRNMDTFGSYGHALNGEAERAAKDVGILFDKIIR